MELTELYTNAKAKMEKCMTSLERDFSAVRAGRANPAVLDKVMVDYYGVPTPVNQMAAISVPEARMLVIQPWDASTLKEIEKAINTSDIGINPQNADQRVWDAAPTRPLCINKNIACKALCVQKHCLLLLGPLQEHTTFTESLVCYTSPGRVYCAE